MASGGWRGYLQRPDPHPPRDRYSQARRADIDDTLRVTERDPVGNTLDELL
jgi:hypothetical protein